MTEKLKTLMHERASRPEFDVPDVDRLVAAGSRRRRRQRGLAVVGGTATVAVVGVLAAIGLDGDTGGDRLAVDPLPLGQVSWAQGSELHTPGASTDLGHRIKAYVRTADGFVFADPEGVVRTVVDGNVLEAGRTDPEEPRLVADVDGSLVGWVDPSGAGQSVVVTDLKGGTYVLDDRLEPLTAAGAPPDASIEAIDGRTVYVHDRRGIVAIDLDSPETEVVVAGARQEILAVEDGVIAYDAGDAGTAVGISRDDAVVLPDAYGDQAAFSPDGAWISVDADEPQVYEVRSGKRVDLDVDGRWFATGYEWLDDHTLVMLSAEDKQDPADLLACDVAEGVCEVAVPDLGTFEELAEGFALPLGSPLGE